MAKATKAEFLSWLAERTKKLQAQTQYKRQQAVQLDLESRPLEAKMMRQEASFLDGMVQMGMEVQNAAKTGEPPLWPFGYGGLND